MRSFGRSTRSSEVARDLCPSRAARKLIDLNTYQLPHIPEIPRGGWRVVLAADVDIRNATRKVLVLTDEGGQELLDSVCEMSTNETSKEE